MSASYSVTPSKKCPTSRSDWPANTAQTIEASLRALDGWLERHHYTGYEPFDGLNSFLRPLTLDSKVGRQLLLQLVKRSPINVRPWLGIRAATSSKGMGFLA